MRDAKRRAKKRNVPFRLAITDVPIVPTHCPALGFPLAVHDGFPGESSPSLDCVDPTLGYVPGNVQWLSRKANMMKQNATPEELTCFAKWVLKGV